MVSEFSQKPGLLRRWIWSVAETFGFLPRTYLAALSDFTLLDKAEYLIRSSQHLKAQKALDALARRPIEEPKMLTVLANLELRNGNKDVARRAQLRAAQAYLRRGMVEEATHVLQQILALTRDCLEARLALGQIAEGRYEHEEAVVHYVEAVKVLTARQDWGGVQELLERVRQLQRVKTVLDGDTQMMPPLLGAGGEAQDDPGLETNSDEGSLTLVDMRPDHEPASNRIPQAATEPAGQRFELPRSIQNRVPEHDPNSETLADVPSPFRKGARKTNIPTVVVEPDLAFPDGTDRSPTIAVSPVKAPSSGGIPSTFVRAAPQAPSVAAQEAREAREAQIAQHTDIVIRDLPPEVLVNFDTAVDFKPGGNPVPILKPSSNPPPSYKPGSNPPPNFVTPSGPPDAPGPVVNATPRMRSGSVWDRAIVQGPRETITLNVGPEPDPAPNADGANILKRATTGISSVLNSFIQGVSKDGGGH